MSVSDYLDQVNRDKRIHPTSGQHHPLGLSPGLDEVGKLAEWYPSQPAFWPQMHPMGHHVFPAMRDYPTWTPRQTKASLPLNSVFSSHSNKKSEHCNHLRVHVLAHECWKTIKHSNHSTAVPIQKIEKQKWFRRPAQYCQPSWYNWYLISTLPNHSRIYSIQAEWNRPCQNIR